MSHPSSPLPAGPTLGLAKVPRRTSRPASPPAKRVQFGGGVTPWAFVLPQLLVVAVFFYWPSVQAVTSSFYIEDPFGFGSTFVGLENYKDVVSGSEYRSIAGFTALFSVVVTALGSPKPAIEVVHGYGGRVIADVTTLALARKAKDASFYDLAIIDARKIGAALRALGPIDRAGQVTQGRSGFGFCPNSPHGQAQFLPQAGQQQPGGGVLRLRAQLRFDLVGAGLQLGGVMA